VKIFIVGAGIMGLSAAWALARDGHQVTVFEQGPVPNPLGSSVDEHRLIRHPYGGERGYTRMIGAAYRAWGLMWSDLGTRHYSATGTLVLDRGDAWTAATVASLTAESISFHRLDPSAAAGRFPLLAIDGLEAALVLDTGGTLFAAAIVADLTRYLPQRGVTIRARTPVRDVDPDRARVILASGETAEADLLVIATGPWATRLLPSLADRVTPSRQVVVYLTPPDDVVGLWREHPLVLDIDPSSGFYLVPPRPFPAGGVSGLKVGDHSFTLTGDPDRDRVATAMEAQAILDRVGRRLRHLDRYTVREAKTCFYDVEPKERFIVEPLGWRGWVLSGFSGHGFKFGAVLGLELARTISGKRTAGGLTEWAAGWLSGESPAVLQSRS
jgi:glycine/D-amino acid oxidase-like deaminating enzyme